MFHIQAVYSWKQLPYCYGQLSSRAFPSDYDDVWPSEERISIKILFYRDSISKHITL